MRHPAPPLAIALALLAACCISAGAEDAQTTSREAARQAALAYDEGRCAQVLGIFDALGDDARARLDGVSHYRRGFCLARLGKGSPLEDYRESARKLAIETQEKGARIDAHFYRVNALLNLDQRPRAQEAAAFAVEKWAAGELTVPEEDGRAWFRLGKLHRDAGQPKSAAEPFRRALALHESGTAPLNEAYLQRIADGGRAAGDSALAMRALAALEKLRPADPSSALRQARTLIMGGDLDGAEKLVQVARRGSGDTAMLAQYTAYAIKRTKELATWDLLPADTLADGTPIVEADLRAELANTARAAFQAIQGPSVEVPRKKDKTRMRLVPAPAVRDELRITQSVFCGLLREAVLQGAPLREWAIADGYAPLIHHPWQRLFRDHAGKKRREAAEPDPKDGGAR